MPCIFQYPSFCRLMMSSLILFMPWQCNSNKFICVALDFFLFLRP